MAFTAADWGRGVLLTGLTPSATLSGFVALVDLSNVPVESIDAGSNSALNGGGDLRFSTDIDGLNQLPLEVVSFVTNASAPSRSCQLWIRFPSYAIGTREAYMFYNKAAETQPAVGAAFGRNAVWSDYEFVSHNVTEDATGNYPNAFTITGTPTQEDGPFGNTSGAYDFSGSGEWIDIDASSRDPMNGVIDGQIITIQAHLTTTSVDGNNRAVHIRNSSQSGIQLLQNIVGGGDTFGIASLRGSSTATARYKASADSSVFNNVVGISKYDNTAAPDAGDLLYIDDDSTTQLTGSGSLGGGTVTDAIRIGARTDGAGAYFGKVAEVKFRKDELSADFISSEYDNQSDASTFWTTGTPFTPSGGITVSVTGTAVPTQTEADVVTGGKTIILTLTGDTFVTGTSSLDGIAAGSLSDIPSNG